jgi:hypothetical protein
VPNSSASSAPFVGNVRNLLADKSRARTDLRAYLTDFDGRFFDKLADQNYQDDFTAQDLVAVTALSVVVPAAVAEWMLSDDGTAKLHNHLKKIMPDAEIADTSHGNNFKSLLGSGSPAEQLWSLLKSQPGVGSVVAGKLLAAKRPYLIPIYDSVVSAQLKPRPHKFWQDLWDALDDPGIHSDLEKLKRSVKAAQSLSLLRVLDIISWMEGRRHIG